MTNTAAPLDDDPEAGITLLEVLIVLAIISLVGVVVAGQVVGQMDRAKVDLAGLQLKQIDNAMVLFQIDTGRFPTSDEGLASLQVAPASLPAWRGPYLRGERALIDPWGHAFVFSSTDDTGYTISSQGSDGKSGGTGTAQDLVIVSSPG